MTTFDKLNWRTSKCNCGSKCLIIFSGNNKLKRIECKSKSKTRAAKINLELANFVNPWMRGTVFKIF